MMKLIVYFDIWYKGTKLQVQKLQKIATSQQLLDLRLPNVTVHSYDDLSSSELVASGHFGNRSTFTTATTAVTARRPSIFRKCYSSENSVLVSNWNAASVSVQCNSMDVADSLVDCLPPHYWHAKHMPRLIKVSTFYSSKMFWIMYWKVIHIILNFIQITKLFWNWLVFPFIYKQWW